MSQFHVYMHLYAYQRAQSILINKNGGILIWLEKILLLRTEILNLKITQVPMTFLRIQKRYFLISVFIQLLGIIVLGSQVQSHVYLRDGDEAVFQLLIFHDWNNNQTITWGTTFLQTAGTTTVCNIMKFFFMETVIFPYPSHFLIYNIIQVLSEIVQNW